MVRVSSKILPKTRASLFLHSLVFTVLLLCASVQVFGCGQGAVLNPPSPPASWITSRYPAINATVTSKNVNLTITFARDMDTSVGGLSSVTTGEGFDAGSPASVEAFWSDNRTFNFMITGSLEGGTGDTVNIIAAANGFRDSVGGYLSAGTQLWKFNYNYDPAHSYSISGDISQTFGTHEGIVYVIAYEHVPTSYNDLGFLDYATVEDTGLYTIPDLGNSTSIYVQAYRNVFDEPLWYAGFPSGQYGSPTPVDLSGGDVTGKNITLTAEALSIKSTYPAMGATDIPEHVMLYVKFNNALRSLPNNGGLKAGPSHEAGMPSFEGEPVLSDDLTTIMVTVESWASGWGDWVHLVATAEPNFLDANHSTLPEGTTLLKYRLVSSGGSYSISGTCEGGLATREAIIVAFKNSDFSGDPSALVNAGTGAVVSYTLTGLSAESYYVVGYRDQNGSGGGGPDAGDLQGAYPPYTSPTSVDASSDPTNINFIFDAVFVP